MGVHEDIAISSFDKEDMIPMRVRQSPTLEFTEDLQDPGGGTYPAAGLNLMTVWRCDVKSRTLRDYLIHHTLCSLEPREAYQVIY